MEYFYMQNGFDGYIAKPIDIDNLHTILEKWLDTKNSLGCC